MVNQTKILDILWKQKRELTMDELVSRSGLRYTQITVAIQRLKQRNLIKKRYEQLVEKPKRGIPPCKRLFVKINPSQLNRISDICTR